MNEDYLWDKKGSDLKIEKLENSLKSFRFKGNSVPLIPAKSPIEKCKPFGFLRFAVPAMACLAFLIFGFWFIDFNDSPSEIAANEIQTQATSQPSYEPLVLPPGNSKPDEKKTERIGERNWVKRKIAKIRKARPAYVRIETMTAQRVQKPKPANKLTKEEKYAYDQLMTALAITSSQFKLVKDKIQGLENQKAVVDSKQ